MAFKRRSVKSFYRDDQPSKEQLWDELKYTGTTAIKRKPRNE